MKVTKIQNQWVVTPSKKSFNRSYGHNNKGHITSRHRCKGHKRLYRPLRWYSPLVSTCRALMYDPNRNSYIAIIESCFSKQSYWILAPKDLKVGRLIFFGHFEYEQSKKLLSYLATNVNYLVRQPLREFTSSDKVHGISLAKRSIGKIALAAGCSAIIVSYDKIIDKVILLLPSGQRIIVLGSYYATSGLVSRQKNLKLVKAGQNFWRGKRPKVRGVAINPVDHAHGGRTSGGRPSVRPWGIYTKGFKTTKRTKIYG